MVAESARTHVDAKGRPLWRDAFYIVNPPHDAADAFYLWCVKELTVTESGDVRARCQEWNLVDGQDPFTGLYEVHKNHSPGVRCV